MTACVLIKDSQANGHLVKGEADYVVFKMQASAILTGQTSKLKRSEQASHMLLQHFEVSPSFHSCFHIETVFTTEALHQTLR